MKGSTRPAGHPRNQALAVTKPAAALAALLLAIFPALAAGGQPSATADSIDRIQGGAASQDGEFQAVGSIGNCTATLVSADTVLTAAHCVCSSGNGGDPQANTCVSRKTFTLRQVRRTGRPDWVREDVDFQGTVYVHPDYERRSWLSDDLAVIKLDKLPWVKTRGVNPIPILPGVVPQEGNLATLVGYGYTGSNCNDTSNPVKRSLTLPLDTVSAGALVTQANGQHVCPGDSGGPMLYAPNGMLQVIGNASWGDFSSSSTYRPAFSSWRWLRRFLSAKDLKFIAVAVKSTASYQVHRWALQEDAIVFTDRAFRFTHVPEQLEGAHYVRTPNNDKFDQQTKLLSWTSNKPVIVYIGHDDRYDSLPSWMSEFSNTGMNVEYSTGNSTIRMSLYRKEFSAGRVRLGGNYPEGETRNFSNYVVIVDDQDPEIPTIWAGTDKVYDPVPQGLHEGAFVYSDRDATFTQVPEMLHGATFVRGAADDKFVAGNYHLYFFLTRPATVYVAHDNRYGSKPPWLSGFQNTGKRLDFTHSSGDVAMTIYEKRLPVGLHVLGGNKPPGDDGNYSSYVVAFDKVAFP